MSPIEHVTDPADPRLRDFTELRDVQVRSRREPIEGLFIAEGEATIRRALDAGYVPRAVLTTDRWLASMGDLLRSADAPILVVDEVTQAGGANAGYVQVAFLFVVMRGFSELKALSAAQFDLEFLDLQTNGRVGGAPPSSEYPFQTGTQLCDADHVESHCPF